MYRRRRTPRDKIHFSFDSFLDVVANVNGIIIRLILVAWVGARAYHGNLIPGDEPGAEAIAEAPALPAPRVEDEPLTPVLAQQRRQLDEARRLLAEKLGAADDRRKTVDTLAARLTSLSRSQEEVSKKAHEAAAAVSAERRNLETVALSAEELQRRGEALKTALLALEKQPPRREVLRYHTPVSRTVTSDEIFFECKNGRVTYLDLPGFLREVEASLGGREQQLRDQFSVDDVTQPIGAFRLRYTIARRRSLAESFGNSDRPSDRVFFAYGLSRFVVEPVTPIRGEVLEQALRPTSEFRQLVDGLDSQTVVTFWVYPDSFALFRTLRDYLHDRGIEVAGRPLPPGEPIGGSPSGSRSRGQ